MKDDHSLEILPHIAPMGAGTMDFAKIAFPQKSSEQMNNKSLVILKNAAAAAQTILEERWIMQKKGDNRPLFVLAGETHDKSSHQIHHLLLAHLLKKSGIRNLAFGWEFPNNLQTSSSSYCAVSRKTLQNYLLQNSVPQAFLDSAVDPKGLWSPLLDMTAHFNRQSALELGYEADERSYYHPGRRQGMHIRNRHMAVLGQAFARATQADIILIATGLNHVIGDRSSRKRFPVFQESLTAEFHKLGERVMAMPYSLPSHSMSYRGAAKELDIPIHEVQGLPFNEYISPYTGKNSVLRKLSGAWADRQNKRDISFCLYQDKWERRYPSALLCDFGLVDVMPENKKGTDLIIRPSITITL